MNDKPDLGEDDDNCIRGHSLDVINKLKTLASYVSGQKKYEALYNRITESVQLITYYVEWEKKKTGFFNRRTRQQQDEKPGLPIFVAGKAQTVYDHVISEQINLTTKAFNRLTIAAMHVYERYTPLLATIKESMKLIRFHWTWGKMINPRTGRISYYNRITKKLQYEEPIAEAIRKDDLWLNASALKFLPRIWEVDVAQDVLHEMRLLLHA